MSDATDLALIRCKSAEGFRSHSYTDTRGFLTIGYGFNVDAGISEYCAAGLLERQIAEADADISAFRWYQAADTVRRSVLVELRFNMGLLKLQGFHNMLGACEDQDWEKAADELKNSAWFGQVGNRGPLLVRLLRDGA
jgi:lysozyme